MTAAEVSRVNIDALISPIATMRTSAVHLDALYVPVPAMKVSSAHVEVLYSLDVIPVPSSGISGKWILDG